MMAFFFKMPISIKTPIMAMTESLRSKSWSEITAICFFFQAEDGIRDGTVTGVRRVLFRSIAVAGQKDGGGYQVILLDRARFPRDKVRSEERRVGKECRSRWSAYHSKNK